MGQKIAQPNGSWIGMDCHSSHVTFTVTTAIRSKLQTMAGRLARRAFWTGWRLSSRDDFSSTVRKSTVVERRTKLTKTLAADDDIK